MLLPKDEDSCSAASASEEEVEATAPVDRPKQGVLTFGGKNSKKPDKLKEKQADKTKKPLRHSSSRRGLDMRFDPEAARDDPGWD